MTVLVLGATGNVGPHVVSGLGEHPRGAAPRTVEAFLDAVLLPQAAPA